VLATGAQPNRFGWPGQDLPGVQGLYSLQDLAALEAASRGLRQAVVVGGGLIGVELAEMLHSRGVHVTLLAREASYWSNALPGRESALVGQVIAQAGVQVRYGTELRAIEAGANGQAAAVVTRAGDRLTCGLVGLTAGVSPNLSALSGGVVPTGRGVLVNAQLEARVEHVYACGDCAEIVEGDAVSGRVEQLWYTGRMQGEVVAANLAGEARTYVRGTPFNSAKFFDLEWHTYGDVSAAAVVAQGERHLWWHDPSGRHALRVVERDGAVVGMNSLGWRHRQDVWTRWIEGRTPADSVLSELAQASFDPEFSRRFERAVREQGQWLAAGEAT